jgi:hypothetical protein
MAVKTISWWGFNSLIELNIRTTDQSAQRESTTVYLCMEELTTAYEIVLPPKNQTWNLWVL